MGIRSLTPLLSLLALVLVAYAEPDLARADENPVPNPRYVEREVDFMWTEGRHLWRDRFRVRAYPRTPRVGRSVRISLRIRRTRNGVRKAGPEPLRVEVTVRREGGPQWVYTKDEPGDSVSFEHEITRSGPYVVSIVTYYTEVETYTIALRFEAERAPDPDD